MDLDAISIDSVNWAAAQIREVHPLPKVPLSQMPSAACDEWLLTLDGHVVAYLAIIGALRRPGRAWVDVQLASHRWVGWWIDDCPTEAALNCAYWHNEPVIAAGIDLRAASEASNARQKRIDAGDLLALLGDDW